MTKITQRLRHYLTHTECWQRLSEQDEENVPCCALHNRKAVFFGSVCLMSLCFVIIVVDFIPGLLQMIFGDTVVSDIVAGVCLLIGAGMFIVAVIGMRLACIASPDVNDIEMMERRSGSESERQRGAHLRTLNAHRQISTSPSMANGGLPLNTIDETEEQDYYTSSNDTVMQKDALLQSTHSSPSRQQDVHLPDAVEEKT